MSVRPAARIASAASCRAGLVRLVAVAVASVAALAAAGAAERVQFADFRTLTVESAVLDGSVWILDHGDGNVAHVPARIVVAVRPVPAPAAPASAAVPGPRDWRARAGEYAAFIEVAARRFDLAPELIVAVAVAESALDPFAESEKGALGVMQIMPETAAELGLEDPFDAEKNIDAGARFLREMLDLFDDDLDLALAAYNAGQGTVRRYGGIPPYPETRQYLRRVRRIVSDLGGGV